MVNVSTSYRKYFGALDLLLQVWKSLLILAQKDFLGKF